MTAVTALEKEVICKLLSGTDTSFEVLRRQFESAVILDRRMTGVGFFTTFSLPENVETLDDQTLRLGNVVADIPGLQSGAGFLLFVEHGKLCQLEGYTFGDEVWPDEISVFKLRSLNQS